MMRSVGRSAAGLAAKRTPAPGQAAGTVDLPGVLATAGRVRVRMLGTLALQRLAELALDLFLGTFMRENREVPCPPVRVITGQAAQGTLRRYA